MLYKYLLQFKVLPQDTQQLENAVLWHTPLMSESLVNKEFNLKDIAADSLDRAACHYENFPVASIFLPHSLREPIALIYSFARQADDFADEGSLSVSQRLKLIDGFKNELNLLQAYIQPDTDFFKVLGQMIRTRKLPLQPFYDLLDAFSQDVTKVRYENFNEVLDYCKRSANPIGRLLLHLYQKANPDNLKMSDNICTALQLINFLQDIAIDFDKNDGKKRIYLCQDELERYSIEESLLAEYVSGSKPTDANWHAFMQLNVQRAANMLQSGKPLGRVLKGRIGFEMRMIIAGCERIISKLQKINGDVFKYRPTLQSWDWLLIFLKALFRI